MQEPPERRAPLGSLGLGFEFAAAIIGGCFLGLWADRRYATAPWGVVVGATVGLIAGLYNLVRASLAAFRSAERPKDDGEDQGGS